MVFYLLYSVNIPKEIPNIINVDQQQFSKQNINSLIALNYFNIKDTTKRDLSELII